jgi:hypothetical protein
MTMLLLGGGALASTVVCVPMLAGLAVLAGPGTSADCSSGPLAAAPLSAQSSERTDNTQVASPSAECAEAPTMAVPAGSPAAVAEAIRAAAALVGQSGWHRRCDRLVCRAYGYLNSGYPSAAEHWQAMVDGGYARPGDRCPPAGAFVYWRTSAPAGHVALVVASDPGCDPSLIRVLSNDLGDAWSGLYGGVYLVSLAELEAGFTRPEGYLGWSAPICIGARFGGGSRGATRTAQEEVPSADPT